MKKIFFIILAITFCQLSFAQISYTYDKGGQTAPDSFIIGSSDEEPIILINGICVNLDTIRNIDSLRHQIGTIFIGVDKTNSSLYNEKHDGGMTFIQRFLGLKVNNGIVFLFTKNKIKYINPLNINFDTFGSDSNTLWKINEKPLTNDISQVQNISVKIIKEIIFIKGFPLQNHNTKAIDTFKLFIIKTKN